MKYFNRVLLLSLCLGFVLIANEKEQTSINFEYGSHDPLKFEDASSNYGYVTPDYYENVIENVKEGNRLAKKGDLQDAVKYFERAIAFDSSYVFAYNGLANTHIKLNNYKKAEDYFKAGIKYGEKDAFLYNNLANLYLMEGKIELALKNLKIAAEYNPNSSLINYNLANIYYNMGKYSAAILYYKKALQLDANMCEARYNLALSYQEIGSSSLMIKEYETLVKRCPGHVKGVLNLAAYYIMVGDVSKALLLYKQALVLEQDTRLYLALGHTYHNLAYTNQEISAYASAVEADSTNMEAWQYLARSYWEQGMLITAKTTCQEALKIDPKAEEIIKLMDTILNK